MRAQSKYDITMIPTEVGERVQFTSYGGDVPSYMVGLAGTVIRFNRSGAPVVELDTPCMNNPKKTVLTDRYYCGKVIDRNDKLVRPDAYGVEVKHLPALEDGPDAQWVVSIHGKAVARFYGTLEDEWLQGQAERHADALRTRIEQGRPKRRQFSEAVEQFVDAVVWAPGGNFTED